MPFLIDVSRGLAAAIRYVDSLPEPWAISRVSAMELIVGARDKRDLVLLDAFLSTYPVEPLSDPIVVRAYELLKIYTKAYGLHVFDSLIAATAMNRDLTLVTLNRKHYQMIKGLHIEVPQY